MFNLNNIRFLKFFIYNVDMPVNDADFMGSEISREGKYRGRAEGTRVFPLAACQLTALHVSYYPVARTSPFSRLLGVVEITQQT